VLPHALDYRHLATLPLDHTHLTAII